MRGIRFYPSESVTCYTLRHLIVAIISNRTVDGKRRHAVRSDFLRVVNCLTNKRPKERYILARLNLRISNSQHLHFPRWELSNSDRVTDNTMSHLQTFMTRVSEVPSSSCRFACASSAQSSRRVGFNRHHTLSRYYTTLEKKKRNMHMRAGD